MKTLLGCCLIHLGIGSVYASSVLFPAISECTTWSNSDLIQGFAITILMLGLTASLHQRILYGCNISSALFFGVLIWALSQESSLFLIQNYPKYIEFYYVFCGLLGISLGLLYVIPINLITTQEYKHIGMASGLVVCCFGAGSIIAAKLYSMVSLDDLFYAYVFYYAVMYIAIRLLLKNDRIQFPQHFVRDTQWYSLAVVFFLNIGIGISLLSNLTNLSIVQGLTMEDAVILVALAGLANAGGRLVYSSVSDYIGTIAVLFIMSLLQVGALIAIYCGYWEIGVVGIISIYGGMFAIMPTLMKHLYQSTAAYSQVLSMWGFSGLICPIVFSYIGISMLYGLSLIIVILLIFSFHKNLQRNC